MCPSRCSDVPTPLIRIQTLPDSFLLLGQIFLGHLGILSCRYPLCYYV